MKAKYFYPLAVLGLAYVLTANVSYAKPSEPDEISGSRFEEMIKELNLTDEQKNQLKAIGEKHEGIRKESRKKKKAAYKNLHEALKSGSAKDADLRKLHSEMLKLNGQMSYARFEKLLAIRGILNPKQRKKFMKQFGKHKRQLHKRNKWMRSGGSRVDGSMAVYVTGIIWHSIPSFPG